MLVKIFLVFIIISSNSPALDFSTEE